MNLLNGPVSRSARSKVTTLPSSFAAARMASMFCWCWASSGSSGSATYGSSAISRQRPADQIADEALGQLRIAVVLDEGHESQRRLFQLDRHLGVGEQGAIDDLRPLHQLGERRGIEPELGGHGVGQELGAALRLRIVELPAGGVGAEMVFVAGQLKCRGVVVEPPGQAGVLGVAKVDAGVFVAVEAVGGERLRHRPCARGGDRPRRAAPWRCALGRTG